MAIHIDDCPIVGASDLRPAMVTVAGVVLSAEPYEAEGIAVPDPSNPTPEQAGELTLIRVEYAGGHVQRLAPGTPMTLLGVVDDELLAHAQEVTP